MKISISETDCLINFFDLNSVYYILSVILQGSGTLWYFCVFPVLISTHMIILKPSKCKL